MGELANKFSDLVIVTDDNPRSESPSNIRKDILKGCPNAEEIPDRNKAINYAISKLQKNDFLLIAGKGHETSQTIGMETLPFDDYTVAKETIKNIEKLRKFINAIMDKTDLMSACKASDPTSNFLKNLIYSRNKYR